MELLPILTRAESLFRRFERTVQAVDKQNNFPAPKVRQRIEQPGKGKSPERAVTTGSSSVGGQPSHGLGQGKEKVISPELRELLSRKVTTFSTAKEGQGDTSKP
jgi:hypothetical protein